MFSISTFFDHLGWQQRLVVLKNNALLTLSRFSESKGRHVMDRDMSQGCTTP